MNGAKSLDWEWAKHTGGALTRGQRLQLFAETAKVMPGMLATMIRLRAGRRGCGRVDFDSISLPDTALAKEAESQVREHISVPLLHHSYRTYFFGQALAALDGVTVDDELAYTASLLHDLTVEKPTPGRCFAVVSGERAAAIAERVGVDHSRAEALGAGIAAHITPGVSADLSDLAGFVSAGASVDLIAMRLDQLDPAWVDELLVRHPRQDFKRHFYAAWAREGKAVPAGRARWAARYAALGLLARLAPFAE